MKTAVKAAYAGHDLNRNATPDKRRALASMWRRLAREAEMMNSESEIQRNLAVTQFEAALNHAERV